MGFKVDSSFLHFLTMGAKATRRVMEIMTDAGLRPIELERYSSSNKLWSTKVKRLRLPDVLCISTGLRVEVRAKSDLAIKMSDAPTNPDRRWHSGLRPTDMIAFVHCTNNDGNLIPANNAELFWVKHLTGAAEAATTLGPPKSASEGSERDRTWPATVASADGVVIEIRDQRLRTLLDTGRKQTYNIVGKHAYVSVGERFLGNAQFLAGVPRSKASLIEAAALNWQPANLATGNELDRFVSAKAMGALGNAANTRLLRTLSDDADTRVALEAAASLAKLGLNEGLTKLRAAVENPAIEYLRMEAVLILSELGGYATQAAAVDLLAEIATDANLENNEVRQAAIWGLGCAGLQSFNHLLPFLDAENDDERVHAIVAMGSEISVKTVRSLVQTLASAESGERLRASASMVLARLAKPKSAITELSEILKGGTTDAKNWAAATLGTMSPTAIAEFVEDEAIKRQLRPLQLLNPAMNWTRKQIHLDAISFVSQQIIH